LIRLGPITGGAGIRQVLLGCTAICLSAAVYFPTFQISKFAVLPWIEPAAVCKRIAFQAERPTQILRNPDEKLILPNKMPGQIKPGLENAK
jgi:hypothetical protein